jgi:hypothetical protein
MEKLPARAETLVRAAQRERLERIAGALRARRLLAVIEGDRVASNGRRLIQQWLSDPLLRFLGRLT